MAPYHESRQTYQSVQIALCSPLPEAHSQDHFKMSSLDTDVQNRLLDSVGESEGGIL